VRRQVALGDITNITVEKLSVADVPDLSFQCIGGADNHLGAALSQMEPVSAPVMPFQDVATEWDRPDTMLSEQPLLSFSDSVDEYVGDITNALFRDEEKYLPQPDYMDAQLEISSNMRSVLIDWLVEVHMKHHLCLETLHLTVNIIDRYLSKVPVARRRLQLIGVVAMFIASKFEEINPPELDFWVYITANAYTPEEVVKEECAVLIALQFQIAVPTTAHFIPLLKKTNGCDDVHGALVEYIVELGLLDTRMLCYPPSHVVSAALLLTNEFLGRKPIWPPAMAQLSRRTGPALRGCAEVMRELFDLDRAGLEGRPRALNRKFSTVQRHEVATMQL
jgi:hypothetical protein